jgi:hypothetical protein
MLRAFAFLHVILVFVYKIVHFKVVGRCTFIIFYTKKIGVLLVCIYRISWGMYSMYITRFSKIFCCDFCLYTKKKIITSAFY